MEAPLVTPSPFDPSWRDDVFTLRALDFDLTLPAPTPNNGELWVVQRPEREEVAFGRHVHRHERYRLVTSLVTRSGMVRHLTMRDEQGRELSASDPALDLVFPPKAWMSDTLEERCMMLAAAELASGDVLVGGLGLAVYPQIVLALQRPVRSLTIVEESAGVIALVHPGWMRRLTGAERDRIRVVHQPIQRFLAETGERFDTIFLDVWTDADPRWLPFVNGLIERALPRCAVPSGRIQCWGYACMVDAFVRDVLSYVEKKFPWHEYRLDPAMKRCVAWVEEHPDASPELLAAEARRLACTVSTHEESYDRERFLGSYAPTLAMAHAMLGRARLAPPG